MESIDKVFNSCYKYIQGFKENHEQSEKLKLFLKRTILNF